MKLMLLPSWYPTRANPQAGVFIRDQAQALAKRWDTAVLAVDFQCRLPSRSVFEVQLAREEGILTCRVQAPYAPGLFRLLPEAGLWLYRRAVAVGYERLEAVWGRPNRLHAHVTLPAGWGALGLGKRLGAPVVLTEHVGPFSLLLPTRAHQKLARYVLRGVDAVLAVSPALAEQVRAFEPATPLSVAGNVIDTAFFCPSSAPRSSLRTEPVRFLAVALTDKGKGLEDFLQAGEILLSRKIDGFILAIGGSDAHVRVFRRQVNRRGLTAHCRFFGRVDRLALRQAMRRCDVFVLPSLGETFGMVAAEAMACGKPVIATRCGGPQFVVTPETGVLVPPGDPASLATAMEDFVRKAYSFDSETIRRSLDERFGETAFLTKMAATYEAVGTGRDGSTV